MRGLEIEYSKDEFPPFEKHYAVAVKPNKKRFVFLSGRNLHKLQKAAPDKLKRMLENPPSEFRRFLNA